MEQRRNSRYGGTGENGAEPEDPGTQQILEFGSSLIHSKRGAVHVLTIVGQIEGHQSCPSSKSTKYEHVMPLLALVEESDEVDGLLVLLNTVGGDVEAGLGIAELIAGMSKPTVSLVLGGGHSIGVPLAVSAKRSFIAPSAAMTIHGAAERPGDRGIPDLQLLCAHPGADYSVCHPEQPCKTGGLHPADAPNRGAGRGCRSVIYGEEAVRLGLIDEIGGLSDALACLHQMMDEQKRGAPQNNLRRSLVCCLFMTPPGTKSPQSHPS